MDERQIEALEKPIRLHKTPAEHSGQKGRRHWQNPDFAPRVCCVTYGRNLSSVPPTLPFDQQASVRVVTFRLKRSRWPYWSMTKDANVVCLYLPRREFGMARGKLKRSIGQTRGGQRWVGLRGRECLPSSTTSH